MCKRTLYCTRAVDMMRAYILIRSLALCLFTNNGREETQYFCSMWNPSGYSISLGMFGGIPTFQPQTIKSMKSPWISAMIFLRQFQMSPGQLKRLFSQSRQVWVSNPSCGECRLLHVYAHLGDLQNLDFLLAARAAAGCRSSYLMQSSETGKTMMFSEKISGVSLFFLGSNQRMYHKVSDP